MGSEETQHFDCSLDLCKNETCMHTQVRTPKAFQCPVSVPDICDYSKEPNFFGVGYIRWPYTNILIQSAKFIFQTDTILESDTMPKSKREKKTKNNS